MLRYVLSLVAVLLAAPAQAGVDIQEVTSDKGIRAWLVEEHSIPFVALEIVFRGGTSLDPADRRGAASLMVALLEEGAGDRDAQAFGRAAEELGARFAYGIDQDEITVTAQMLTENRDATVQLLRESLTAPRFDADAVTRVKAQMASAIRSNATDPHKLASQGLSELIYGDHPYAFAEEGTLDSVAALTRDDLAAALAAGLTRDRLVVSAVGDITPADLSRLLDTLLGALPETGGPDVPDATLSLPGGVTVHDFETPQSVVLWAQPGIDRQDPDYFAAFVLDHIIGGSGFDSRLMTEVREKRGLTYGVSTHLIDHDHARLWIGYLASANDRVKEAVDVVRAQWRQIHDQGVTQAELDNAKTYLTGAYPLRFDGNARIAGILTGMQAKGLSRDYVTTRNARIEAVTLEDIDRVARDRMSPEGLTFYVVGQPDGLGG